MIEVDGLTPAFIHLMLEVTMVDNEKVKVYNIPKIYTSSFRTNLQSWVPMPSDSTKCHMKTSKSVK